MNLKDLKIEVSPNNIIDGYELAQRIVTLGWNFKNYVSVLNDTPLKYSELEFILRHYEHTIFKDLNIEELKDALMKYYDELESNKCFIYDGEELCEVTYHDSYGNKIVPIDDLEAHENIIDLDENVELQE